jgi:hypothetical protein
MIRASLICLLLGSMAGAALLGGILRSPVPALPFRAAHLDLMLFGWLVQFVLGVAHWILPRHATLPERGPAVPVWSAFVLFQAGLVLALMGTAIPSLHTLAPPGRVLLAGASLLFLVALIPRVKPFGSP